MVKARENIAYFKKHFAKKKYLEKQNSDLLLTAMFNTLIFASFHQFSLTVLRYIESKYEYALYSQ
jgi:hypothetical protein